MTETFTTKSGLAPSIMRSMFKRRNTIYIPRIFKILKQKEKRTLYFGLQDTYKLSDFLKSFVNDLTCQKKPKNQMLLCEVSGNFHWGCFFQSRFVIQYF